MHQRLLFIIGVVCVGLVVIVGAIAFAFSKRTPTPQPVAQVPDVRVTVIEGLTIDEVAAAVERQLGIPATDFERLAEDFTGLVPDVLASKPAKASLEGYLFPDTYLFAETSTVEQVIARMLAGFETRFGQAAGDALPNTSGAYTIPGYESLIVNGKRGLTVHELVTLASILERETGRDVSKGAADSRERLDEERRVVAGIFYNRLVIGQALQSDATVNYVTGKKVAAPSSQDLAAESPYNTYKYAGLPPGPIANPSLSSLKAVLNPTKTGYYYFLHKQPSGEVVYSRTFEEHVANKNRYLR